MGKDVKAMEELVQVSKIKDMVKGKNYTILGEVDKQLKQTKTEEPYFDVKITDNRSVAYAKIWQNLEAFKEFEKIENKDYVEVNVICTDDGQYMKIDVQSIKKVEKKEEIIVDMEVLKQELRKIIKDIKDAKLRALINAVFSREDVIEAFFKVPASQMSGYSFKSGLLAHVVRLVFLTKSICSVLSSWTFNIDNVTSKLNEDLMVTACLLHDIGKVKSLKVNEHKVEKTIQGELFEDSYVGLKIVLEELPKAKLTEEQSLILEHILGSSKGKQNFGALHIPRSREAIAFHFIESLDVQMGNFEYMSRNSNSTEQFMQLFQKTMFLGNFDEE